MLKDKKKNHNLIGFLDELMHRKSNGKQIWETEGENKPSPLKLVPSQPSPSCMSATALATDPMMEGIPTSLAHTTL